MPKDKKDLREQDEKFHDFFTTSVVDIPVEMTRRDEDEPQKKPGVLGRLFGHGKKQPEEEKPVLELPTGEILLGADAKPEQEADLELVLRTADPAPEFPQPAPEPAAEPKPEPAAPPPAPKPVAAAAMPEVKPAAVTPQPEKAPIVPAKPALQPARPAKRESRAAPEPLLPQEKLQQEKMQRFKDLLDDVSRPTQQAAKPKQEKEKKPEPVQPRTELVFASVPAEMKKAPAKAAEEPAPQPESKPEEPTAVPETAEKKPADAPKAEAPAPQETPAETPAEETAPAAEPSAETPETPEETPAAPAMEEAAAPAEPAAEPETKPELPADKLHRMSAELTLRCVLSGILAIVLLHLGLTAEGLMPALNALNPDAAPAAFYGANLLLYAASLFVAYPVLRDGLTGLRDRPSADTMPALAAAAALLQAVVALLNANTYRNTNDLNLLTGMAALGLFLALLGSRVMLAAVQGGYELMTSGAIHNGAYRTKDKDLIRALARDLEQKDPWVLLDQPLSDVDNFVEQSLDTRASERRARKTARILLGVAVACGVLFLLAGAGINKAVGAMTAMLCLGAPLSSTLIAGIASLRLQRSAAAVGAVVPGWKAIEELGGIDTLQVDTDDLFAAANVEMKDIRIFKGGRIDRAILYAASVLNQSCDTLRGLFEEIIENRTEILFPVKDLEEHHGLGFSAWCDNNRVLIGNRKYMEQEEVPLPDEAYEAQHSKNGELQILYLAVSGSLHAMFVLHYVGGRNVARSLTVLQKENIRLLVTSKDPSLTARHITEAYHLPEGMITLLDGEQETVLDNARRTEDEVCCMIHPKGFASLTGGLQAADQAQNAETSATSVQLASVWVSIVIGVLLTYAGNICGLSTAVVLMYQAAWSALSIAMCALRQRN